MKSDGNIVILGPTATGKTRIAALVAHQLNTGVISADSRQVYKGMDLGTGKDLIDYKVEGSFVEVFLTDIAEAGEQYSVYQYMQEFRQVATKIQSQGKAVVICGGSGLYLEAALGLLTLAEAPADEAFRLVAGKMENEELVQLLKSITPLHNTTDLTDRNRLIRAIEVARAKQTDNIAGMSNWPVTPQNTLIAGVQFPRQLTRSRITERLRNRLEDGMLNEVEQLLNKGLHPDQLIYYGLEYKYLTQYLTGKIVYSEMVSLLNTAIHQFAKRQMTWFRKMEKKGISIHWLNGEDGSEYNAGRISELYQKRFNNVV